MYRNKLPAELRACSITLRTEMLGVSDGRRVVYAYELRWHGKLVFEGREFSPSPMDQPSRYGWNETLPKASIITLLGFLTLRLGDTDDDYFKNYTPEQFEFANSQDAEAIRLYLYDEETEGEEVRHEA